MPLGVSACYWNTTGICLDLQPTHVPLRAYLVPSVAVAQEGLVRLRPTAPPPVERSTLFRGRPGSYDAPKSRL